MPRYEYSDAKSNRFWEIELEGASHTVRYGRIGTDGQVKTKEFADAAKAEARGSVEAIAPLLEGTSFPLVTDLGLMNSEFADELCAALPKARIAKQIERLDLSLGILTRPGAEALAAGATSFPKLKELTVADNYVDDAAAAALKFAFPFVEIGEQDKLDDLEEEDGEVWRFVTVGE